MNVTMRKEAAHLFVGGHNSLQCIGSIHQQVLGCSVGLSPLTDGGIFLLT